MRTGLLPPGVFEMEPRAQHVGLHSKRHRRSHPVIVRTEHLKRELVLVVPRPEAELVGGARSGLSTCALGPPGVEAERLPHSGEDVRRGRANE